MSDSESGRTWYRQDAGAILRALGTSAESGLSASDAALKLEAVGPNEIQGDQPPTLLRLLAHQFADFMIALLVVAAVISGVVGDIIDTVAIIVIVVVNAAVGVSQEYRAQRAVAALRRISAPLARVVRDGSVLQVPARDVVPGDVVLLEVGDVVPADLRLIDVRDLGVDESALTGESVPVAKHHHPLDAEAEHLSEYENMAFKSTLVTRGKGTGVVVATGRATEIGRVADLLRGDHAVRTPLQVRLAVFSRRIALAVIAICAIVFVTGLLRDEPLLLMFLTALSLAVAAVPEALPAVITIALGLGARRLSQLNALVRRLPAVESLGSVTYICADKTGTLTENRMRVGIIVAGGRRYPNLAAVETAIATPVGQVLALCNDVVTTGAALKGEPTELALLEGARAAGFDKAELEREMPRIAEVPFESGRRCMVTLHRTPHGRVALIKGAPERIIPACVDQRSAAGSEPVAATWMSTAEALAGEGYRVLAVAIRENVGASATDLHSGWSLLALVGLIDPPRADVGEAIHKCVSAGIVPVMITGDHPATAHAIAARTGIISNASAEMTGTELNDLTDAEFDARVEATRVYARVDPEQKIRIVQALQRKGHFVAMTGDGVNDAPALKYATIGIAMGQRGTEVAREAAEIVLLDDSFSTIVAAVQEGRRIFDDIRKFIRYALTGNSGEIFVLLLAPFLGLPLPLLPLHILWVNLVTDGFPGLALSAEPAERDVMRRKPRPPGEGIFTIDMVLHIFWVGLAIGAITLGTQAWAIRAGIEHWQTLVFTVLVFTQLVHSIAIRSERDSLFKIGLFGNPALLIAVIGTVAAQLLIIYVPAFNVVFHTAPLSAAEIGLCFAVSSVVLLIVELEKLVRRHSNGTVTGGTRST